MSILIVMFLSRGDVKQIMYRFDKQDGILNENTRIQGEHTRLLMSIRDILEEGLRTGWGSRPDTVKDKSQEGLLPRSSGAKSNGSSDVKKTPV